jgi:hypothetical protein
VTGAGSGTPLVVVNGGPGFDHTYLHIATAWDTLGKIAESFSTTSAATADLRC